MSTHPTVLLRHLLTVALVAAASTAAALPVELNDGNGQYGTDRPFTYKATAGKSGTAKNP